MERLPPAHLFGISDPVLFLFRAWNRFNIPGERRARRRTVGRISWAHNYAN